MRFAYAFVLTASLRIFFSTARPEPFPEYDDSVVSSLLPLDAVTGDSSTDLFAGSDDPGVDFGGANDIGLTPDPLFQSSISSNFDDSNLDSLDQDSLFLSDNNVNGQGNPCLSDVEGVELLGKREKQMCSEQRPTGSGSDPNDFLNNLPIFDPKVTNIISEDQSLCPPYLVGNRPFPVCFSGEMSDLAFVAFTYSFDPSLRRCLACTICP